MQGVTQAEDNTGPCLIITCGATAVYPPCDHLEFTCAPPPLRQHHTQAGHWPAGLAAHAERPYRKAVYRLAPSWSVFPLALGAPASQRVASTDAMEILRGPTPAVTAARNVRICPASVGLHHLPPTNANAHRQHANTRSYTNIHSQKHTRKHACIHTNAYRNTHAYVHPQWGTRSQEHEAPMYPVGRLQIRWLPLRPFATSNEAGEPAFGRCSPAQSLATLALLRLPRLFRCVSPILLAPAPALLHSGCMV